MSVSDWIAVGGIAVVIIGGLIKVMMDQADIKSRLKNVEEEIGDTDTGLRGDRHRSNNLLATHKAVLYFLCRKAGVNGDLIKSLEKD